MEPTISICASLLLTHVLHKLRATSHTRLEAHDHKAETVQVQVHITLEGEGPKKENFMDKKVYMEFDMADYG